MAAAFPVLVNLDSLLSGQKPVLERVREMFPGFMLPFHEATLIQD